MVSIHRHKKLLKRRGVPAEKVDACKENYELDKLIKEEFDNASNGPNPEIDNQG